MPMSSGSSSFYARYGKRILDLVLTVPALVVFLPALVLVAVLVRIRLGSPVLFCQQRPGLHGQPFTLYKFRTMTNVRDAQGNLLPDGERLTHFGRFLRSTSLDELPELFNVLRGEMSLVGPRPLLMRYYPYFTEEEQVRFLVQPGITGLAQVSGRNDLPWDLRLAVDVRYVQEWSLWLDMWILVLTIWRILTRHGLRVDPGANMLDLDEERRDRLQGDL
jgi:lipopolysaccharide/colanic/teichoic acid biosynthesis glycosyltransferase